VQRLESRVRNQAVSGSECPEAVMVRRTASMSVRHGLDDVDGLNRRRRLSLQQAVQVIAAVVGPVSSEVGLGPLPAARASRWCLAGSRSDDWWGSVERVLVTKNVVSTTDRAEAARPHATRRSSCESPPMATRPVLFVDLPHIFRQHLP
jgi:hypothetical protein